jgi:FMN reductase [NAD(P)H]
LTHHGVRGDPAPPEDGAQLHRRSGRKAPSGGLSQGARFVVVTDPETRSKIAELADEPYYIELGYEPWISRAPVHVVVAMREDDYHDRYREPDKLEEDGEEIEWRVPWWRVDAGKAVMLLLLAAVDEGLGAGLFGLLGDQNDRLRELLGMPEDMEIVGAVTVGHPAPEPMEERRRETLRRRRRPLEEVVRWERW